MRAPVLPPPQAVSLVLADQIYRDGSNGKFFILGTYNAVFAPAFPLLRPSLHVYATITDGRGQVPVRLTLTDADEENEPLAVVEGEFEAQDPLKVCEILFHVENVVLPRPGLYRLKLFGGGELLRELRFHAIAVAAANGGDGGRLGGQEGAGRDEWDRPESHC